MTSRTYASDVKPGTKVLVKGWVQKVRDLGGLKFFSVRDRTGSVQVTLKKGNVDEKTMAATEGMVREDCILVEGNAKKSDQAPGGLEIIPDRIEIINRSATPLPIEIGQSGKSKRFDYRFLDMRDPKVQAYFRLKSDTFNLMREYYIKEAGFVEVNTPVIQAAGAEGGATMFPVIYYQQEAFLRQSPQLYKQMIMASGLDRVLEIGQAFRAEEFHTRRHVCEFMSIDCEMAWIDSEEDVFKVLEGCINYTIKKLKGNPNLKALGIKDIKVPELPFKRVTYDEALELISKEHKITWGDDLGDPEEKTLGEIMKKRGHDFYFITKYPSQIKPFYIMMDGKYSRGFDLGYRGMEITSGGQREHRYDVLVKVMKSKGLDPAKFKFYLDAFKYGMPPHGGFGLGGERFLNKITGIPDIKEFIMFPRTPDMLVP